MTESQGRDAEEQKADLIERVAARIRELRPAAQAADAERFAHQFYANVAPSDILHAPVENLATAALSLWDFAQERRVGTAKVRVYNTRAGEEGWRSSNTIVEIVNDDMPFLVDSVTADLVRREAEVHLVIHPIVRVSRDEAGRLSALHEAGSAAAGSLRESCMHLQISEQPESQHEVIRAELAAVLADVRSAVEDWRPMRERLQQIVEDLHGSPPPLPPAEVEEGREFLRWLDQDSFTYLGYREYRFEGEGEGAVARVLDGGLGLLRDRDLTVFDGLRSLGTLPEEVRLFVRRRELLSISKSNRPSTVHRRVPLDTVAIKTFDAQGAVVGERLFIGLFTSAAYSRSARLVPLLRRKVESVVSRAGFAADSHDGKALLHILETYPRDELFQISDDELSRTAMGILHLQERQRVALFTRRDPYERYVSCLVFVPRDRYDTKLRHRFQEILAAAYRGSVTAFYTHLTDEALARLHFMISTTRGLVPAVDPRQVEEQLIAASRSWLDRVSRALADAHGEALAMRLTRRYGQAFQVSYQDAFDERAALFDIARLEEAIASGDLALNLYRPDGLPADQARFKVYSSGPSVPLSNVLPMLDNLGLEVIDEIPYEVRPQGAPPCSIRDFQVKTKDGQAIDLEAARDSFQEAFRSIFRHEMEDDGFNRLVLSAGLVARQVTVLRAYCKYLRQVQIPFSQAYMEQTLAHNPEITHRLVALFAARFDPAAQADAGQRAAALVAELEQRLDKVTNLDEDRIIRRFLNLIESTLRTNYYKQGDDGRPMPYLALKLDSQRLDELPKPRPFREVFVYSPRVEAIHLRGGKVARGGIRWSDRPEDFRTEVLGLMKAQMVKNAVIVPVGSKGGFVVRRPPAGGREKLMEEVVHCYRTLMCGLLDLTDNLVGSRVVPPPSVVRRDDD
ncbi:MAG TPA: NAD-glutamate dehydrogenase domain-containing protein, partial [Thermoanaerobaculia bacterium]